MAGVTRSRTVRATGPGSVTSRPAVAAEMRTGREKRLAAATARTKSRMTLGPR